MSLLSTVLNSDDRVILTKYWKKNGSRGIEKRFAQTGCYVSFSESHVHTLRTTHKIEKCERNKIRLTVVVSRLKCSCIQNLKITWKTSSFDRETN